MDKSWVSAVELAKVAVKLAQLKGLKGWSLEGADKTVELPVVSRYTLNRRLQAVNLPGSNSEGLMMHGKCSTVWQLPAE
jgi:hypothetical protein